MGLNATNLIGTSHLVDVGAGGDFLFNPNQIDASVGDVLIFRFLESNHTVTQSSFEQPCMPSSGFDSGFRYYNPRNQTGVINQVALFLVRDTEPVWFFCRQGIPQSHCAAGMVFGLNVGDKLGQFVANARSSSASSLASHAVRDPNTGYTYTRPYNWNTSATAAPAGVFFTGYASGGGSSGTGIHSGLPSSTVFTQSATQTLVSSTLSLAAGSGCNFVLTAVMAIAIQVWALL